MADEKKELVEAEVVVTTGGDTATLAVLEKVQIDTMIATAHAYPRSLTEFREELLAGATLDAETAESMVYALPRDGKLVTGPSIRMAEAAASAWGNVRLGARVIEIGDEYLTARGHAFDLQRNVGVEIDVRRRIVNKYGKRYGADMIQTTGLAACAIALRNAIFKVVPAAYIKPALEAAKRIAAGDAKTLGQRRDAALLYFKDKGIRAEQVFRALGVKGKEDIGLEQLAVLVGIRNALKEEGASLADFFAPTAEAETKGPLTTAQIGGWPVPSPSKAAPEPVDEPESEPEALSKEKAEEILAKAKAEQQIKVQPGKAMGDASKLFE